MFVSVSMTAVIILAVFINLSNDIRNETEGSLRNALESSERQVLRIREEHLADLMWVNSQVSANPTLRAALETYRIESGESDEFRDELLATLQNELDKIWNGLRHDLLFVTDQSGSILAANSITSISFTANANMAQHPVVQAALNPTNRPGIENFGLVEFDGQFFFLGSSPIVLQDYIIGTLAIGNLVGSTLLPELRDIFGGETVVTAGNKIISSTLQESYSQALEANDALPGQGEGAPLEIADQEFVVTSMALGRDEDGQQVSLYLLRSITEALREPNRKLIRTLAVQASIALILAALLSWIATRAGLKPLQRFVDFMKKVGETGDYSRRFVQDNHKEVENPHNELDLLINGFNNMIAEIEARDSSIKKAHADLMESIETLHQKEEQLRQLQKMEAIGLLAGGVAHDFNNILMVISGFSELALKSLPADHEASENIDEVLKASKTASLLTRQLLAFSSKQITKPRVVAINSLIEEIEKILSTLVGHTKPIMMELDPEAGSVLIDPAQMEQILLNLTVNARDAIKLRGEIRITTRLVTPGSDMAARFDLEFDRPHVMVSVKDDGCGMDSETRSHMFEPCFTTKKKGKGTGLGLSTVHGIVKQAGGQIRVESEPDKGTTMAIFLPQIRADADEHTIAVAAETIAGTGTILLVEDESDVRKVVSQILQMNGYHVIDVSGPQEALAIVEESGDLIDVLVTDVVMPVMNGRELNERVQEINPEIRVLYISGYAGGVVDESGVLPEGVNFLQKPFAPEDLLAKLHRILNDEF
jgi:signal transduction histidine kinase/CheY-like chemotaxis protein